MFRRPPACDRAASAHTVLLFLIAPSLSVHDRWARGRNQRRGLDGRVPLRRLSPCARSSARVRCITDTLSLCSRGASARLVRAWALVSALSAAAPADGSPRGRGAIAPTARVGHDTCFSPARRRLPIGGPDFLPLDACGTVASRSGTTAEVEDWYRSMRRPAGGRWPVSASSRD